MKFAIVFVAILAQAFSQGTPYVPYTFKSQSSQQIPQSSQFQNGFPAQVQGFGAQASLGQMQGYQQQGAQANFGQNLQQGVTPNVNFGQTFQQGVNPQANLSHMQGNQQPIPVSNEAILALAAQNGLDVEAVRQSLMAGIPVEIEVSNLNAVQQTPQPPKQNKAPTSLSNPQAIKENLKQLVNTATDARTQQVLLTPEFEQWHSKLLQSRPEVVGMRHSSAAK